MYRNEHEYFIIISWYKTTTDHIIAYYHFFLFGITVLLCSPGCLEFRYPTVSALCESMGACHHIQLILYWFKEHIIQSIKKNNHVFVHNYKQLQHVIYWLNLKSSLKYYFLFYSMLSWTHQQANTDLKIF